MTLSVDWTNRWIISDRSILDLPAFHATLRDFEDDETGVIYPITHTWKALDLGSGAFFYQADLINGYSLKFSGAGPYQINGNLNGSIIDTGVQVERKTSSAYVTTAIGGSGPSAADIAETVWQKTLEAGYSAEQLQRLFASILLSKVSGAGSGVESFRDLADSKDRVIFTVDDQGNRMQVTRNAA